MPPNPRKIVCIVCGEPAEIKKVLSDIRQDMMIIGTYCQHHALEQCDNERNIITRLCMTKAK